MPAVVVEPAIVPQIAEQQWFLAKTTCAQGPFELEVPLEAGGRWEQEVELRLSTPRNIALNAVMLVDGAEVAKSGGVWSSSGPASGGAQNTKCLADARERLVLGRTGGSGGGVPDQPGTRVTVTDAPPPTTVTPQLDRDDSLETVVTATTVLRFRPRAGARVKIRFWSIEPNDLVGVRFGTARIVWRPNVDDATWEVHLAERERRRLEAESKWQLELERRQREARERPPAVVVVKTEDPRVAEERRRREEEKWRRDEEERRRKREQDRLRIEEADRRRALEAALEADRVRRRAAWCKAHPDSRDCWGAGGMRMHLELEMRAQEREAYCRANRGDARCWTDEERTRRKAIWAARTAAALAPPKPPDGPPPAPLADIKPPALSENATWRDGYWQWVDGTWVWLAGQWRVPESDIAEERTTRAPQPPPPPPVETVVVAPAPSAVWIPGFWQWNGSSWIWFAGSYQLRPERGMRWRAPEWQPRGSVHVLIPGGWIRGRR